MKETKIRIKDLCRNTPIAADAISDGNTLLITSHRRLILVALQPNLTRFCSLIGINDLRSLPEKKLKPLLNKEIDFLGVTRYGKPYFVLVRYETYLNEFRGGDVDGVIKQAT